MPSPTIVIAIVALVAAMGGVALAGPSAKKVTTKKVKKIADKEIAKQAPSLSVAHAGSADSATSAANATQAQNAGTANGVKPINVNLTAADPSQNVNVVDQGGVKAIAGCTISGHTSFDLTGTANNGSAYLFFSNAIGTSTSSQDPDLDTGDQVFVTTTNSNPNNVQSVSVNYRGADGTTLTGQVLILDPTVSPSGGCQVSGDLLLKSP